MKKIFSLVLLTSLISPSFAIAANTASSSIMVQGKMKERRIEMREDMKLSASSTRTHMASSTKELGFCSQIDKALVSIERLESASGDKKNTTLAKNTAKREEVRTQVDERRDENDTKRKAQLEELMSRAKTDEQKTAMATFTTIITKALADKKTATDAVLLTHRKEVDQVTQLRKEGVAKALTALKSDIDQAKTKAKADCASGIAGDTVRTNLKNALLKAQENFKATVSSMEKIKDIPEANKEARKKELQTIEETFKKAVEKAKNDLKLAFKASVAASTTPQ